MSQASTHSSPTTSGTPVATPPRVASQTVASPNLATSLRVASQLLTNPIVIIPPSPLHQYVTVKVNPDKSSSYYSTWTCGNCYSYCNHYASTCFRCNFGKTPAIALPDGEPKPAADPNAWYCSVCKIWTGYAYNKCKQCRQDPRERRQQR